MPDLDFSIESASPVQHSVAPLLSFSLRITTAPQETIHSVALRCQIWIEPAKRRYQPQEQSRLVELFGQPARWSQTLRSMLWTNATVIVPPFTETTTVDLPVACTHDFNVAAAKYFDALEDALVPLRFMFSGTIFHAGEDQQLQVAQIQWSKEAAFSLPVATWKQLMDAHYAGAAWLCLRKDTFDQLYQYKMTNGLTTWEATIEQLLAEKVPQ
jgi:Family of unknown function (DUF6084)